MIRDLQPDSLTVMTSDNRHADIAVFVAETGVGGIFCEKRSPVARVGAKPNHFWYQIEAGVKFWLAEVIIYLPREILLGVSESPIATAKLYHKRLIIALWPRPGARVLLQQIIPYK